MLCAKNWAEIPSGLAAYLSLTYRQTYRHTYRQTYRQTDKQTDRQTDRQTEPPEICVEDEQRAELRWGSLQPSVEPLQPPTRAHTHTHARAHTHTEIDR